MNIYTYYAQLIKEARVIAKFRGHAMGNARLNRENAKQWRGHASCKECGMSFYVCTYPPPNDTEISGQAVAIPCKDKSGYVIQNKNNHELWWSDTDGWVEDTGYLSVYTRYDRVKMQLPLEGKWVRL